MDVLQSAQARVDAVLNTINGLKRGTFPQDDSQKAIGAIERIFEDQKSIIESLGPQDSKSVVDNHCNSVLRQMFHLLPVLGFLHRSKNRVINQAVEGFGPAGMASSCARSTMPVFPRKKVRMPKNSP